MLEEFLSVLNIHHTEDEPAHGHDDSHCDDARPENLLCANLEQLRLLLWIRRRRRGRRHAPAGLDTVEYPHDGGPEKSVARVRLAK